MAVYDLRVLANKVRPLHIYQRNYSDLKSQADFSTKSA